MLLKARASMKKEKGTWVARDLGIHKRKAQLPDTARIAYQIYVRTAVKRQVLVCRRSKRWHDSSRRGIVKSDATYMYTALRWGSVTHAKMTCTGFIQ